MFTVVEEYTAFCVGTEIFLLPVAPFTNMV